MTKKLTKRFVSFLVTLAMVVTLLPIIPAMAAPTPAAVTDAATFAAALDSTYEAGGADNSVEVVDANTVKLLKDVTLTQTTSRPEIQADADVTLDLNGKKLNGDSSNNYATAVIKVTGGSLTIKDSTAPDNADAAVTGSILVAGGSLTLENGAVITKSVVGSKVAAIGSNFGGTITVNNGAKISGNGALIAGNGVLDINSGAVIEGTPDTTETATVSIGGEDSTADEPASATIDGKITGDVGVFAYGKLVVEENAEITNENGFAISTNGSADGKPNASTGAEITIEGGKIKGAATACGIYAPAGDWTIDGGEISGGAGIVVRGGDVDVKGGTITATAETANATVNVGDAGYAVPAAGITVDVTDYPAQLDGQKHVTVSGNATVKATADGGKTLAACEGSTPVDTASKVADEKNPFDISGGTFQTGADEAYDNDLVSKFLPEGNTYNNGTVTFTGEAQVTRNDVKFASLKDALKGAEPGDVIKLEANVNLPGTTANKDTDRIKIDKQITIDLNGKTLTKSTGLAEENGGLVIDGGDLTIVDTAKTGKVTGTGALLLVSNDGKLTIGEGATIEQTAATVNNGDNNPAIAVNAGEATVNKGAAIKAAEIGINVEGKSKLTVNDGSIEAGSFGVCTNGAKTDADAEIQIKGGHITSTNDAGVYLPRAKMTVSGETTVISGKAGVVVRGGKLTVKGGIITSTAENDTEIEVGDGDNKKVKPAAVVVNDKDADEGSGYGEPKLDVQGGKFATVSEDVPTINYEKGTEEKTVPVTVAGGTFTKGADETPDVAVSKYMDTAKGMTDEGEIKPANEVTLQIIDFGYVAEAKKGTYETTYTSPAGIEYKCSDWIEATFYFSFNRALTADEEVTVTFTGPDGVEYSDTIKNSTGIRFATSFINPDQLGKDVAAKGFQAGDYTIGAELDTEEIPVAKSVKPANIEQIPEQLKNKDYEPVVYKATFADHAADGSLKDIVDMPEVVYDGYTKDAEGNVVYKIKGTAKSIKEHYNYKGEEGADSTLGYWFGVAIEAPADVTTTTGGYTVSGEKTGSSDFDTLKDDKKGAIIYFNVGQETDDDDSVYTITIKWSETVSYTYKIDLTGVKYYAEPEPKVALATIADKDGDIKDIYTGTPTVELKKDAEGKPEKDNGNYTIVGKATDLKSHTNGADKEGNWFGITIQAPTDIPENAATYTVTFGDNDTRDPEAYTILDGNKKAAVIYFNVTDNEAPRTLTIKWSDSKEITYNVDLTGVKLYKEPAPTVAAATIADGDDPALEVVDANYKAEYKDTTTDGKFNIVGEATNLKKHVNGDKTNPVSAYWFGVEIEAPTDVVVKPNSAYTLTIDGTKVEESIPFETLYKTTGAKKGAVIYFQTKGDGKEKHEVTIEWNNSKKITYNIDLTDVKHFVEAPTVNVGNEIGGTASTNYSIDAVTYTDKTTYKLAKVTFKTTGEQIVPWNANGAGTEGNWVGITVQPPADSKITGLATAATEALPAAADFKAPDAANGDSDQLSGYYVNANSVTEKPYFFVKIADEFDNETIYCYLLVKDENIKLEARPVADPTVKEGNTTEGVKSTDYTATVGDYTDAEGGYKLATVTFTTTGEQIVPWNANGAGTEGNWIGITVAPSAGDEITGLATSKENKLPDAADFKAPEGGDSAQLSGYYVDASQDIEKPYFFVKIKNAAGTETVYCYNLVKGTPLELAEKPATKYSVTCETATGGKVTADNTTAAEGDTVTLTVTADSGYDFSSLSVKDAEGTEVETTAANGKYTFTMPASNVTVTATFKASSTGRGSGSGRGGSGGSSGSTYSVSVPSKTDNGTVSVSPKNAAKGSKVTITVKPDKGYMTGKVTVKDASGNEIEVTDNGDGTYSFVMPDSKVSIAAEFVPEGTATTSPEATPAPEATPSPDAEENCPSEKFTDVDQSQWYHEGIDYALTNGLMSGMSDTTFEPNSNTTRAMIVAVLYRLDGSPAVAQASFADVPAGAWFTDAVAWGEANGIVSGYDAETFGPEDSITREQMAAIMYRYAQYKGVDVSAQADLSGYSDAASVSDWANTSLSWANAAGLITGMSDTELAPTGTATRAQIASILMRFCENIIK